MTAQAVLPPLSSEIRKSGEYQALSVSLSVSAASALRGLTDQRVVLASPMPFSGSTSPPPARAGTRPHDLLVPSVVFLPPEDEGVEKGRGRIVRIKRTRSAYSCLFASTLVQPLRSRPPRSETSEKYS